MLCFCLLWRDMSSSSGALTDVSSLFSSFPQILPPRGQEPRYTCSHVFRHFGRTVSFPYERVCFEREAQSFSGRQIGLGCCCLDEPIAACKLPPHSRWLGQGRGMMGFPMNLLSRLDQNHIRYHSNQVAFMKIHLPTSPSSLLTCISSALPHPCLA